MSEHIARSQLLAQMMPPTQSVAQFIETTLAAESRNGLLVRHDIGVRLRQAVEEKATYGCQAVRQIAEYVGMSADRLYKLCSYAESYTQEQLEQWAIRPMSSGGRLSYNHLTTLLVIRTGEERVRLVERILEEALSVRALRVLLYQIDERPSKPIPKKKSILSGLDQMIGRGKGLINKLLVLEHVVFNEIANPNRRTIDPLVRNRIIKAQMTLEELSAGIAAAQNHLTRNLARVDQLLG